MVHVGSTTTGEIVLLSQERPVPPGPVSLAEKVVSEFKLQMLCPVQVFPERLQELGAAGETLGLPVTSSADPMTVSAQLFVLPTRLAVTEQLGAALGAAGSGAVTIL
jgi:hypothetical protein